MVDAAARVYDGRYAIDIRTFLAIVTLTMLTSFLAGVAMVPPSATDYVEPTTVVRDSYIVNVSKDNVCMKNNTKNDRPFGKHLLVDIMGVEGDFLNSEERLSKAMVDTAKDAGLTILSYHCHSLAPSGVSCVGVLSESHISFHTWPSEGVITLDLFTTRGDAMPPVQVVDTIEEYFGMGNHIRIQWSHELRGFLSDEEKKSNYLADSSDLSLWVLSPLEMHSKKEVYAGMTKYQRVDIWDIVEVTDTPTYEDVLKYDMQPGDERLTSPKYVTPDRLFFVDGTLQSLRSTEKIYHETMVHPAMFAHPNPKRVAILGGGEGATLREVLKHKTVRSAVMIEIDYELVKLARAFLPDFSNCTELVGRSASCFEDDLVTTHFQDGRQWFMDRFGPSPTITDEPEFDVLLVDALDPEEPTQISDGLYSDDGFVTSLVNSLSDDGVLAIQVGSAATIDDPRPDFGIYKNREALFKALEANAEVEAMLVYEEPHCGFLEPHAFLIVCKNAECRSRWYARSDQVDYEIYDRIVRTHSKKRALTFFDGTTQRSYQWPKKGWETVYCRREPTPFECDYRNLDSNAEMHEFSLDDDEESSFRVETAGEGGEKISHVYATKPIPKGSFIMAEHMASSLLVTSRNLDGLKKNRDIGVGRVAVIEDLLEFFDDYAHESAVEGSDQHYVEIAGSVLIRRVNDKKQANVQPWVPRHPSGKRPKYSPVYERHRVSFDVFVVASKDIEVGEEITIHEDMWSQGE